MKGILIASALGLLLLAGGCSSHRGHYGGGGCGAYWSSSYTGQQSATIESSTRLYSPTTNYTL